MEKTLRDWTARRAGGAITVTGTDVATGERIKIAGVVEVRPGAVEKRGLFGKRPDFHATAVGKGGELHTLLLD